MHRLALVALVALSVTGGPAHAQAATVPDERTLERQGVISRWQEAKQAQVGTPEPIPEPLPTVPPQAAPAGDRRGNAIATAAALLVALVAIPFRRLRRQRYRPIGRSRLEE
jgi:hypothetical protein